MYHCLKSVDTVGAEDQTYLFPQQKPWWIITRSQEPFEQQHNSSGKELSAVMGFNFVWNKVEVMRGVIRC